MSGTTTTKTASSTSSPTTTITSGGEEKEGEASPKLVSSQGHHQQQLRSTSPPCTCPTSLHTLNESITRSYSQCPVCLSKFDTLQKLPIALQCSHTICFNCAGLLIPNIQQDGGKGVNPKLGTVNFPLLSFLDYKFEGGAAATPSPEIILPLCNIARLIRSHTVSRSIHRRTIVLINSLTPGGEASCSGKLYKPIKSLGERTLVELTSSCAHVSHYHAQQQLWAAIRARACQFMGPAMQDEALKLVLLALEDGSALSRKVLVMFCCQRLAPQFQQASKTSVGHIVQLLYRASAFDVLKRQGNSSLMTLRPEFRNYEALRREHDTQIMKIGLEAGIRFTPEQWSSLLYGDTSQKPLMQSIIDKLQSPQTFQELLKEYLVSVQRLSNPDSQFLVSLHPHFKVLSMIEIGGVGGGAGGNNNNDQNNTTPEPSSSSSSSSPPNGRATPPSPPPPLPAVLDSLYSVLFGLITFTANRKHQRSSVRPPQQQQQQQSNNNNTANNGSGGGVMMMYGNPGGSGANNNKHPQQQPSPPSSCYGGGMKNNMSGSNSSIGIIGGGGSDHHGGTLVNGSGGSNGYNNGSSNNSTTSPSNNNNLVNMMQANLCI